MSAELTPLDGSFLEIEQADDASHMHVGWAMVFDAPAHGRVPSLAAVRTRLAERLEAVPRFTQRLSEPRAGGLSWPEWQPDDAFDVRDHLREAALPNPAGEAELLDWLADFWSHRLDRTRPLWEVVLIRRLAGRRWVLATKTHHCLADGISSVDVTHVMLDATPQPGPAPPPAAPAEDGARHGPAIPGVGLLVRGARAGAGALAHPRQLGERAREVAELIVRDELIAAPETSFNVPIGAGRRYRVARAQLGELKQIKRALGGTVNDAVLAVATGALRRFVEHRGEPLPARGVRAMVPVSLREASEHGMLGNRVSSLFAELPVAEADPRQRYVKLLAETAALKASGQAAGTEAVVALAGLAPPVLHAIAVRAVSAPRLFNITITNIPGPRATLYAFGAPMREVLPLVPIFAGHAIGIAVVSYDGGVWFGLNADAAVGDLDVLAEGIEASLAELLELARG
ncbi:MAG: wax ester/triacylglycerol synthase family O-acyltransferase [Solirubrobacteraceae bacterium]